MEKGTKFGHYTIEKKIGEGGMGAVYLARDNSLERPVALKILSDEFAQDTERVQRLKQEAKAASALNHPNIITIYEIGRNENIEFIAMEYVDGETLREVIEHNNLTVLDAVQIAEQIADGLCVAHREHIAHRDIKPENIIIRRDGYVRILDFGLAKPTVFRHFETESETVELVKTAPGVVMGSVRYMSPEQARGKSSDERSDIWSLGIVLFEMLCGKSPFDGETVSDTLANLIHLQPQSLVEILPNTPTELNRIVQKSLEKDLAQRYQTAQDFAADLKKLRRELELHQTDAVSSRNYPSNSGARQFSGETKTRIYQTDEAKLKTDEDLTQTKVLSQPAVVAPQSSNHFLRYAIFGIIGVLLLGGLAFIFSKFFSQDNHKSFLNKQISQMSDDGKSRLPAISPDGKYIAFQSGETGARNIMVRQLATGSAVEIAPISGLKVLAITFSPDGNYVYYVQSDGGKGIYILYQVPTLGGTPKKIVEDIDSNISFAADGKKFAFIRHSGTQGTDTLFTVNADGTDEKPIIVTTQTEYGFFANPAWSPVDEKILITVGTNIGGRTENISLAEVTTDGNFKVLPNGKWVDISDILWKTDGTEIFALANEKEKEPKQVWKIEYPSGQRRRITNDTNSYNWLGISGDNRTLITVKSDASSSFWSFSPTSKDLNQLTPEAKNLSGDSGITSTPNGNLIVTRYKDSELNLWEITADGKDVQQITANAQFNADPKISPDGTKILFMSNRSNFWRVWVMDIDGKNPRQLTVVGDEVNQYTPNFVDNGQKVFYIQQEKNGGISNLMSVPIEGGTPQKVFPNSDEYEGSVFVSPNGKFVALQIVDKNYKKYLRIIPLNGDKLGTPQAQFEIGLMESIKWSPDSKYLTYLSGDGISNIWQISLDGKDKKQLTNFTAGRIFNFAWSKDGKQIFITRGTVNNELILIKDESK